MPVNPPRRRRFEKRIRPYIFKKFPFVEPKGSLARRPEPVTCWYLEPDQSIPLPLPHNFYFFQIWCYIILPSTPKSSRFSLSFRFRYQDPVYVFLLHMRPKTLYMFSLSICVPRPCICFPSPYASQDPVYVFLLHMRRKTLYMFCFSICVPRPCVCFPSPYASQDPVYVFLLHMRHIRWLSNSPWFRHPNNNGENI